MLDQGSPFNPYRERSSIGAALATLAWLKAMELAVMQVERSDAHQPPIIRGHASSYGTMSQHPGIDTVGFPHLCQLLARLLEAQLIAQGFCFVALHDLKRRELSDFLIEPVFAYFQRGEAFIPTALALFRHARNIFHDQPTHPENLPEKSCETEFPLPSGPG